MVQSHGPRPGRFRPGFLLNRQHHRKERTEANRQPRAFVVNAAAGHFFMLFCQISLICLLLQDMFDAGLVLGDTDYRQLSYRDRGRLPGEQGHTLMTRAQCQHLTIAGTCA